ncbi:MAG TPA: VTT domain-containing protein [Mycobacteriales bacterium]|nr:VTT domain-containing protein [Mycobacteriales bacterium]
MDARSPRTRTVLLWLAGIRVALALLAVPIAPLVYRDNFLLLVLIRPSKEVVLAAGFLFRQGELPLWAVVLAALPLHVLGIWQFFYLGRAFEPEIRAHALKPPASRLLPQKRIDKLDHLLEHKGDRLVFFGRLAAFPAMFLAAAAGSSRADERRFLLHDGAGALLGLAELLALGYLLGTAYRREGATFALLGAGVVLVALAVLGRLLARDKRAAELTPAAPRR